MRSEIFNRQYILLLSFLSVGNTQISILLLCCLYLFVESDYDVRKNVV